MTSAQLQTMPPAAIQRSAPLRFVQTLLGGSVSFLLLLPVPWMAVVIAAGLAWDQAWLRLRKTGLAAQAGVRLSRAASALARAIMRDERNAPYLYSLIGIGIYTPALLMASFLIQQNLAARPNDFPVLLALLAALGYHVLMMGPYFRFFAYISTLVHKEGHDARGLFKPPFHFLNRTFGWILGPLYGHVPEAYPLGHLRIHHKHDNGPEDVTCTLPLDRSDPSQWLVYLRQFALYWTGISIVGYFAKRHRWAEARRMALGMAAYYGVIGAALLVNPWFGFFYLLLPHLCVIIYLAAINYTWHTFCDPTDPENPYINSVTILNGQYNVFNEDYHVTHHQRPQLHWTEVPGDYRAHLDEYRQNRASIFAETQEFEMFMWIIMKRLDLLASHFVDLTGTLSPDEKIALLRQRMQPVPDLARLSRGG